MRRLLVSTLILIFSAPSPGDAQTPRGSLEGVVIDHATETPIAGAEVELFDSQRQRIARVLTDSAGFFHFRDIRSGSFQLRAGRIGYRHTRTPTWRVAAQEVLELEIRLDMEAVPLAPLTVVAARQLAGPSPVLDNYRARLESGFGTFITRDDIERNPRSLVTDFLSTVPGVRLVTTGSGFRRAIYMNRQSIAGDCPAQIYIDGRHYNRRLPSGEDPGFALDDAVSPGSVQGIEIYRGLSGVPAEFMSPEAPCGVVAIWTRRGDEGR